MTKNNLYKIYAAIVLVTAAVIACLIYFKYITTHPSTDNAYVKANDITISSQVNGKVMKVKTCNYSRVKKGQILFTLDKKPYELAVYKAKANYLNILNSYDVLKSQLQSSNAQIDAATAKLNYLKQHLSSEEKAHGGATLDQIKQIKDNVAAAEATRKSAQADANAIESQVKDLSRLTLAETELNQAKLDLEHCVITAPVNGIVNRLNLQPGENITAASPLFSIIDTSKYWVSANFKETKLRQIKKGQKVKITFDAFPHQSYQGTVALFSPATGAIGSLLQPENATGNWIKVTQRVPVKIAIDGHPDSLIDGQSAHVTIDINSHA